MLSYLSFGFLRSKRAKLNAFKRFGGPCLEKPDIPGMLLFDGPQYIWLQFPILEKGY